MITSVDVVYYHVWLRMIPMAEDRKLRILEYLFQKGNASVAGLSEALGYSEATIRRDLLQLAREGQLVRVHGGAAVRVPGPNRTATSHLQAKNHIGQAAAQQVEEGDVIGFNGGSTTFFVAQAIKTTCASMELTAVTNALDVAMELSTDTNFKVVVIGGVVSKRSLELGGPLTATAMNELHLTKLFVGVDGFSLEHGITTHYEVEGNVTKHMIGRSQQVIVVADHTKLGRVTFAQIAPSTAVHTLITDMDAPDEFVAEAERKGIRVIRA
jgi:DeoR family transcriptional regulator, aga operon transcriptional repressor